MGILSCIDYEREDGEGGREGGEGCLDALVVGPWKEKRAFMD